MKKFLKAAILVTATILTPALLLLHNSSASAQETGKQEKIETTKKPESETNTTPKKELPTNADLVGDWKVDARTKDVMSPNGKKTIMVLMREKIKAVTIYVCEDPNMSAQLLKRASLVRISKVGSDEIRIRVYDGDNQLIFIAEVPWVPMPTK